MRFPPDVHLARVQRLVAGARSMTNTLRFDSRAGGGVDVHISFDVQLTLVPGNGVPNG